MHDPMVVAHEVVLPIPVRRWKALGAKRSCILRRRRRTNEENIGEPIYPWWRPAGYETRMFGYEIGLYRLATIWHHEPRDADSGDVCPHHKRVGNEYVPVHAWRWHVHHWRIQVHPYQALRRWLFDRCATCRRPFRDGHSPITFQWTSKPRAWWAFWRSADGIHHETCANLVNATGDMATDCEIIRALVAECRVRADESECEALRRLYKRLEFRLGYRLVHRMGYEFDNETHAMKRRQDPRDA